MKTTCASIAFLSLFAVAARSRAQDAPSLTAVAPAPRPAARHVSRLGLGLRVGFEQFRLSPPASVANQINQAGVTASDFSLSGSAVTLTPTMQIGGAGYFFKIDLPVSFASGFTTLGLGLYPINYGVFIPRAALMPYASVGGAVRAVRSGATADPGTSEKFIGAIAQSRLAIGAKYFPTRALAVSAELGYSPWAAGFITTKGSPGSASTDSSARGGVGTMFDLSVGAEWL
ncbi:MAG: hypothetical protein ABUR63_10965 [Verrucomicrobiota bacterium]